MINMITQLFHAVFPSRSQEAEHIKATINKQKNETVKSIKRLNRKLERSDVTITILQATGNFYKNP